MGGIDWLIIQNFITKFKKMIKKFFIFSKLIKKAYSKLLNPKNDVVFKKLFGTEKNQDILINFINSIVKGKNVKSVQFMKTQQDIAIVTQKQSIVDVLCKDQDNSQYIIEMQVAKQKGFIKRAQYYAAKAYSNQIQIGDEYTKLNEIIFIAITDFVMFPEKKEFLSNHVILDKETKTHDLKDFSFTFLELPKFNKKENELKDNAEKWFYFFKNAENISNEEMKDLIENDQTLQKAFGELNSFNWTKEELEAYEARIKIDTDLKAIEQQMIDDAKEKGKVEEKKEIAKRLLKEGFDISTISKITKLTKDEILSL